MIAPRRAILLSIPLILWMTVQGPAQQPQSAALSQLQTQYRALEAIDRDPRTPPEVKNQNRSFLEMRRAELRDALVQRISDLRNYLSSTGAMLKPEERQTVELSISKLEAELKGLSPGESTESSGAVKIDDIPVGSTMAATLPAPGKPARPRFAAAPQAQGPCPANLIEKIVIRKSSVRNTLRIILSVSLSKVPASDATEEAPNFNIPGSGHIEISIRGDAGEIMKLSPDFKVGAFGPNIIIINITAAIPDTAKTVNVTLKNLIFDCPGASGPTLVKETTGSGKIASASDVTKEDIKNYTEENKKAAAKKSDDKNFRMGFMAAKGDGEKADGAADISFNKTFFGGGASTGTVLDFFDQADVALQVKKSSAAKTDARQMALGLNLLKTYLIAQRVSLADAQRRPTELEVNRRNAGFFRVLTINEGLRLEGEAFDFKTSNFVSDTTFEIASIPKKIGSGFFSLNIFGGPELGRNMSKPDAATTVGATAAQLSQVDWITRIKAGGEFALRLLPSANGDNWGIEFNAAFVNRTLFNSEVFTEQTTDAGQNKIKTVTIGQGNKTWRQANLKVFLFGNEKARYGVNVSYMNGRLPPAFSPTKGFQFGLLVESTDDQKGGQPANSGK